MARITKATFDFLSDLKSNNNRDWFQDNKSRYEESQSELVSFADGLLENLNQFDQISTPSGKKSLYRIYRDVRFSKNKEPYKINRSGSFAREGANRRGGYYFSISPGNSMVGGGFYQPNKDDLQLIRQQIEMDATPLRKVLADTTFKNYYGELLGDQLKTVPRGFEKDSENIDLLRFKSFYVFHSFEDREVLSDHFLDLATDGFRKLNDFFQVMTDYLTTNLNGESIID